jgi:hypothetical protein
MVGPIKKLIGNELRLGTPDKEGSLIDRYMAEGELAGKGSSLRVDGQDNLLWSIMDMFLAGTDTVSAYVEWFVLYVMLFPKVQEKCFKELEAVVGNRSVMVEDRSKTHYMDGVILEIQRHCPHMALTVQHSTTDDCTIAGYQIPKGTQVQNDKSGGDSCNLCSFFGLMEPFKMESFTIDFLAKLESFRMESF